MSLVTPQRIREAYSFLRECPPFSRWGLPDAAELRFEVLHSRDHAEFDPTQRRHAIRVNPMTHLTLEQLFGSVAHEMVHLRQEMTGRYPVKRDAHNADFRRWAKQVCHSLGFDVQTF